MTEEHDEQTAGDQAENSRPPRMPAPLSPEAKERVHKLFSRPRSDAPEWSPEWSKVGPCGPPISHPSQELLKAISKDVEQLERELRDVEPGSFAAQVAEDILKDAVMRQTKFVDEIMKDSEEEATMILEDEQ
jgi:hypothetical protein